jgi:hypothetical protein
MWDRTSGTAGSSLTYLVLKFLAVADAVRRR